jgi:hypothetical protein
MTTNNSRYPESDYKEQNISRLKEIWEPRKEYIEKDLWVIRNFLSEEELSWLMDLANDPKDWYTTMRSPYGGNIRNKFIGYVAEYDDNGIMILPGPGSKIEQTKWKEWPIEDRLEAVVEPEWARATAFQSFFEVPDEQIVAELGHNVDYAMEFHYETGHEEGNSGKPETSSAEAEVTAAVSIYINDDFDGGALEFKNKNYLIKPEAGMLVNVPLYKEFEHKVNKVNNGTRHTIYGRSWDNANKRHFSTNEDC